MELTNFVNKVFNYIQLFIVTLTPNYIYDFWGQSNTDELYDYIFPENGWICWWCNCLYYGIEFILDTFIKIIVNLTQLHDITRDDFYK